MGFLSWLNGPQVTAKDKAILDLKRQRDKIKQYQKRIDSVRAREHTLARQCLTQGDKKRALLFLRKEQFQKQLMSKTDEQLTNLEELVSSIEFAQIQRDVVIRLELGARILREINSETSLERVEKIMDDSAEGIAYQNEVEALLNERVTNSDEDEVEREFRALEQDVTKTSMNKPTMKAETEDSKTFPAAPKTKLENGSGADAEVAEKEQVWDEDFEEERQLIAH